MLAAASMNPPQIDKKFLIMLSLLLVLGLVMLTSASGPVAWQKFGDSYWYVKHQLFYGLLPGLVLFFLFSHIDYRVLRRLARPLFYLSLILLLLVFVPGIGAEWGTSKSWIGFFNFSFQPAEVVKLTLLLFFADWLANCDREEIIDPHRGLLPFLLVLGLVAVLLILQPDLGSLSVIAALSIIVFFLAGAPWMHLAGISAGGVLALWILIKSAPYRAARLMTFLQPELDPQGIGYHINQALLAIGSGGIFGMGLGHSRQKFQYLPEVAGDSIFAIMGEEFGFIVTALFVLAFLFFIFKILKIAKKTTNSFAKLFTIGFAIWIGGQAFINMGAMVGVMPLTGVPLPLVSFGGTALMTTLAACGVVVNINKNLSASSR